MASVNPSDLGSDAWMNKPLRCALYQAILHGSKDDVNREHLRHLTCTTRKGTDPAADDSTSVAAIAMCDCFLPCNRNARVLGTSAAKPTSTLSVDEVFPTELHLQV